MTPARTFSGSLPKPRRGDIWLIALDPTQGSEIQKTRPCVVMSSNALQALPLRIIVPVTGWQARHGDHLSRVRLSPDTRNHLDKASSADALQIPPVGWVRQGFALED